MDQEILDLLLNFDTELDVYKKNDQNGRFYKFMAKKGMKDHRILPTRDGSIVIGPRGDLVTSNTYLVKYPNNGYYIGPLAGQNRHGLGYRTYADPDLLYYGEYVNNLKSGKGKLWSRKEKRWVYDGSWANDVKNGYGEMWKNGVTYKGNWANDKLEGIGRMDWPSGQNYEGSFSRDLRNGEGTMTFPNGDQYSGGWKNGRPHGKGGYMWKGGEVYNGTWTDGVMDGSGEIDYGIPVKGMGSVRMGSVQELNYQLQRPSDWQENIAKSSQFIKSYRETIIPDSVRRSLKADVTSSVGAAGFGGKAAPNINYSYGPDLNARTNTNTVAYGTTTNVNTNYDSGYNAKVGTSNFGLNSNVGGGKYDYNSNVSTGKYDYNANAGIGKSDYNANVGTAKYDYNANLGGGKVEINTNAGANKYDYNSNVGTGKVEYNANVGGSKFDFGYPAGASQNKVEYNANAGGSKFDFGYPVDRSGANVNIGSSNAGYTTTTTNYQTTTGGNYLGVGSDGRKTAYAVGPATVEKYETKVETKTIPTGGSYGISTNAGQGAVVTTTYQAENESLGSKVKHFAEDVKDKITNTFKSSNATYDVKNDGYNSNMGGASDGYKVSTGSYQVSGPGRVEFGTSNDGNLRIGRADLNSENIAYNANKPVTYTTTTKRVEYN